MRAFGIPGFPAEELVEAQWLRSGGKSATATHALYSVLTRTAERTTFPVAHRFGLGVLAAAPLAGGWLAGAYRSGTVQPRSPRALEQPHAYDIGAPANRRKLDVADRLGRLADAAGLTLLELAVGFALTHPDVSSVVIGPRTVSHVDAYAQAAEVVLDDGVLDAIDAIAPPGTHVLERDTGVVLPASPGSASEDAPWRTETARTKHPAITAARTKHPAITAARTKHPAITAARTKHPAITAARTKCPSTAVDGHCTLGFSGTRAS
ncbi:aldo/keto reductase [Curtobacterium flaccumfaciens]|nr:aldo/keto reductase [Curtobacterium flaccumfaciens]